MAEMQTSQTKSKRLDDALVLIRLPLENLEFTLEQYLIQNGCRLDTDTRVLLAGVRDCVAQVAVSTRELEHGEGDRPSRRAA